MRLFTTICPITNGLPTRMTKDCFDGMCEINQYDPDGYCALVCQGKKQIDALEIITIGVEGKEMATNQRKVGTCFHCRKQKATIQRAGHEVCVMCENVRSSIRTSPAMVVAALKELAPEYLPATGQQTDTAELEEGLRLKLAEAERLCAATKEEVSRLLEIIAEFSARNDNQAVPLDNLQTGCEKDSKDTILLDIALGVITGHVCGIDADTLSKLRT